MQPQPLPHIEPATADRLELKDRIHDRLLKRLDFSAMGLLDPMLLRAQLAMLTMQVLEEEGVSFSETDREEVIADVMNEILDWAHWNHSCKTQPSPIFSPTRPSRFTWSVGASWSSPRCVSGTIRTCEKSSKRS